MSASTGRAGYWLGGTTDGGGGGMTETADVVVIGGGVQGTSLAFHLASRGARTVVVQRSTIAAGATGRSSGLVRIYYPLLAEARIAAGSRPWFPDWEARGGGGCGVPPEGAPWVGRECGFTRTGFLWTEPGSARDRVRANVRSHVALGADSRVVDAAEMRRLAPALAIDDDEVAAWEPGSGYADPSMTASSLVRSA